LSDDDVKVAEEVLQVLKPLKTVTTLLSTETAPFVSMILPLKTRILQSMDPSEEDSTITRDVKAAIREDLNPRYPLMYRTTFIYLLHCVQGSSPCLT
jgi:chromatin segregation and condensation protein Rec8/ScpA/Scc1 (kleisin family)